MTKKFKDESEESKEVKKTTKEYTLRATRNHWLPDGSFVAMGAERKVDGTQKEFLMKSRNYELIG